jgi:hypothetical protein
MTTNNPDLPVCEGCSLPTELDPDARMQGYAAIYRAQSRLGDKLPWREERKVFHNAVHEYYAANPGKINS